MCTPTQTCTRSNMSIIGVGSKDTPTTWPRFTHQRHYAKHRNGAPDCAYGVSSTQETTTHPGTQTTHTQELHFDKDLGQKRLSVTVSLCV